jgi:hypothetical protein
MTHPTGRPRPGVARAAAVPAEPSSARPELNEAALADAATSLWRAQRRLDRGAASARSRQTARFLRACRTALADAGLVVQDHDGDAFHPGRSLAALAFQDDPSLTAETVLETVRPTVYLHEQRIQMGQVIVGRPAADAPDHERTTEPGRTAGHERTDHA